ncbi:unnamed protein product [Prunus armeniaca]
MEDELHMIEKNSTWELVNKPTEKPVIGVKWIYKTKLNLDGSLQKNKARLVAKGYAQKPRLDYNETYAPMARLDTIRTLIALATQKEWKPCKEDKVYRLHKALYGLEYVKGKNVMLIGFCDSDWSGSIEDSKCTSGYAFSFGSGVFSWASIKKNCVALSTAEAEYINALEATAQAIWLRFVLEDFGELQREATPLQCDNTFAIAITYQESCISSEDKAH